MRLLKVLLAITLAFGLSACSTKFRPYHGPEVTSVQVHKAAHKIYLLHDAKVLKHYDIALGFAPVGHKQFEGDGKTPEGTYFISHRNPDSNYYLSLGISYPNDVDREYATFAGKEPGGDIFIHGRSNYKGTNKGDWTAGCVAVSDREMEMIYSMVKPGTPIHILP